jgi:hypothetical protein
MINEYVRECKIGTGSYGKVVSLRSPVLQLKQYFDFNYALAKEYWLRCSTDSVPVHPGVKKCWLTAQLSQVFDNNYLRVHTLYLLKVDPLVSMKI